MKNSHTEPYTVDLHCLSLEEAKQKVSDAVTYCINRKIPFLKVITGKDNHGNIPVLMNEIPKYVENLGYSCIYECLSDRNGSLEKGSFKVGLEDTICYYNKQQNTTPETLGSYVKIKEEKRKPDISILQDSTPSQEKKVEIKKEAIKEIRKPVVKINNIAKRNDNTFVVEFAEKKRIENYSDFQSLKRMIDEKAPKMKTSLEKQLLIWEQEHERRNNQYEVKKIKYKGHRFIRKEKIE